MKMDLKIYVRIQMFREITWLEYRIFHIIDLHHIRPVHNIPLCCHDFAILFTNCWLFVTLDLGVYKLCGYLPFIASQHDETFVTSTLCWSHLWIVLGQILTPLRWFNFSPGINQICIRFKSSLLSNATQKKKSGILLRSGLNSHPPTRADQCVCPFF